MYSISIRGIGDFFFISIDREIERCKVMEDILFSQGMYKLPKNMSIRFWLYLNFLPNMVKVMMYLLFLSGAVLLVWSILRILFYQTKKSSQWLEMERKRQKMDIQIDPKIMQTNKICFFQLLSIILINCYWRNSAKIVKYIISHEFCLFFILQKHYLQCITYYNNIID